MGKKHAFNPRNKEWQSVLAANQGVKKFNSNGKRSCLDKDNPNAQKKFSREVLNKKIFQKVKIFSISVPFCNVHGTEIFQTQAFLAQGG
ncbi:MAG: hypothetical protein ACWGMZ_02065 [Thermoguttaceae bacterium]